MLARQIRQHAARRDQDVGREGHERRAPRLGGLVQGNELERDPTAARGVAIEPVVGAKAERDAPPPQRVGGQQPRQDVAQVFARSAAAGQEQAALARGAGREARGDAGAHFAVAAGFGRLRRARGRLRGLEAKPQAVPGGEVAAQRVGVDDREGFERPPGEGASAGVRASVGASSSATGAAAARSMAARLCGWVTRASAKAPKIAARSGDIALRLGFGGGLGAVGRG